MEWIELNGMLAGLVGLRGSWKCMHACVCICFNAPYVSSCVGHTHEGKRIE